MKYIKAEKFIFCFFIFCFIILSCFDLSAQVKKEKLSAKEYFEMHDYNRALPEYLKLYKEKPADLEINQRIGICYLSINDDRAKAIPYLELVYNTGKYDDELLIDLGKAYMYNYKFDDAIKFFNKFREKTNSKNFEFIDHLIENCENAKELIKKPVNVSFENLGKEINSPYADYYPFVTKDEGTLYFTTRRPQNASSETVFEGFYSSDIYYSKVKGGEWAKAKSAGPTINSMDDEECVCLTPDGKTILVYAENIAVYGDIFISNSPKGKSFPTPEGFKDPVNTNAQELEACINNEGNFLIFSSNRSGGSGEADLYQTRKLPNGDWGTPVNLGSNVNTKYKESFPVFDEENNVLYFASEGHTSMGGFDIFRSKYNTETKEFGPAENIGYPINTPEDNMEFTLAGNRRDGYISSSRKGGFGDLDIYKVIFNDVENKLTVFKGVISTGDSLHSEIDAFVSLIDTKSGEELDAKNANPKTGRFIFALEPGKYKLKIASPGFKEIMEDIIVYDKSDYKPEIIKSIALEKPQADIPKKGPVTNNTKPGTVKKSP